MSTKSLQNDISLINKKKAAKGRPTNKTFLFLFVFLLKLIKNK